MLLFGAILGADPFDQNHLTFNDCILIVVVFEYLYRLPVVNFVYITILKCFKTRIEQV